MNFVFPASRKPVKRYTGTSLDSANFKQLLQRFFLQSGSDDAESACYHCGTSADTLLTWNIVEIEPVTVGSIQNAFCPENYAVINSVTEIIELLGERFFREFFCGLKTPALEDLIGIVMMVMVVMLMLVFIVFVMMVVMIVLIFALFVVMVVMMLFLMLLVFASESIQVELQGIGIIHGLFDQGTVYPVPGRGNYTCVFVESF